MRNCISSRQHQLSGIYNPGNRVQLFNGFLKQSLQGTWSPSEPGHSVCFLFHLFPHVHCVFSPQYSGVYRRGNSKPFQLAPANFRVHLYLPFHGHGPSTGRWDSRPVHTQPQERHCSWTCLIERHRIPEGLEPSIPHKFLLHSASATEVDSKEKLRLSHFRVSWEVLKGGLCRILRAFPTCTVVLID